MWASAPFEGTAAIRRFFEDWWATWEDHHQEIRDFRDFGNGVLFAAHPGRRSSSGKRSPRRAHAGLGRCVGERPGGADDRLPRHRRGSCCRRMPRRGTGLGDVAGERGDRAWDLRGRGPTWMQRPRLRSTPRTSSGMSTNSRRATITGLGGLPRTRRRAEVLGGGRVGLWDGRPRCRRGDRPPATGSWHLSESMR